jgi:hypothetical protein
LQQTVSPEQQRTPEHPPPQAGTDYSDALAGREALEDRYIHYYAPPSGGILGVAYERFLQMPVAVVLPVLWVAGMALLSLCVLMLYILGASLVAVVAGA